MTPAEITDTIKGHHRQRRFAMKMQQKIDRALESFAQRRDVIGLDRSRRDQEVSRMSSTLHE